LELIWDLIQRGFKKENKMAEVEYGGVKLTGSKLFMIIPLVTMLGGGLWASFEFYKDYMDMKVAILEYTEPDLSHIDNHMDSVDIHMTEVEGDLALVEEEFKALKQIDDAMNETIRTQVNSLKEDVGEMRDEVHDVEKELKEDAKKLFDSIDKQDERNRNNVETVRGVINASEIRIGSKLDSFENRMQDKVDALNKKIDTLEDDLDKKIAKALENPLNAMNNK